MGKQLKERKQRSNKTIVKEEQLPAVKKEQENKSEQVQKEPKKKKDQPKGKKNRLIIRNLVFDIGEKHIRKLLSPFGEIIDIQIPTNPNNPKCNKGFAFVEFSNYRSCQKAIKQLNQSNFKGRPIVIDFSISKTKFMTERIKQEVTEKKQEKPEEKQEQVPQEKENAEEQRQAEPQVHQPDPDEDLSRTVFIRNLPISVNEQALKEFCAPYGKVKWAKVVVDKQTHTSKGTAFVKFVKHENAKDLIEYSKSYEMFLLGKNPNFKRDPKINLELEGTIVKIFPVEKREAIAEKIKVRGEYDDKKKKKLKPLKKIKKLKDLILYDKQGKRNIELATLGFWEANQNMAETDQQRFNRHAKEKVQKLKNPNNSVSDRRVCLKFLDKAITEQQIREVALECLSANQVPAKQLTYCKLMLDKERARSSGFAFLQFKQPQVAKMFVEQLAENQEALMPKPFVVQFALQDSRKLQKLKSKNS